MLDIIGMTEKALTAKYGKPARVEPSEYGFQWYVYNKKPKEFHMAGVLGGVVTAAYAHANNFIYKGIKPGSAKSAVRAALGAPLSYLQKGNVIHIISDPDQKDIFEAGGNFVIVFYDLIKGGGAASVLIVPKALETDATVGLPELSPNTVEAYQRISIDLVNSARAINGFKTLSTDKKDMQLAVSRSKDMRDRDYFSHYTPEHLSPFDLAKKMGIKYKSMGENIAFGNHNAIWAHVQFMNSPGHRSNILKKNYTKIGVGAAYGGSRYVILTQIYTG